MMSETAKADVSERLGSLRRDMERELRSRQRTSWTISIVVLALSIVVAAVGAAGGVDVLAMLGEWRTGVIILVGAAFLFSFTTLIQHLVASQGRKDLDSIRVLSERNPKPTGEDFRSTSPTN